MNKNNKKDNWPVQEDQIIKDCQNKNIGAYKMIYDRYEQPLLHTALRITGQQQDAEDVVQMTFIKLYKNIGNYHFGGTFSTGVEEAKTLVRLKTSGQIVLKKQ